MGANANDDSDAETTASIEQKNTHCNSISKDMRACKLNIGNEQRKIHKSEQSKTMPRSSLALMNSKLSNNETTSQLSKQSMLLIHGSDNENIVMEFAENSIPQMIAENEEDDTLQRGDSFMSRFSTFSNAETPVPSNYSNKNISFDNSNSDVIKLETKSHAPRSSLAMFGKQSKLKQITSSASPLNITLSTISSPTVQRQINK